MWNERVSYCSVTQRLITAQKGTRIYKKNRLICLFQSLCDQFFESIFQINCNRRRHSPQAFVQSTFVRRTFWACPFGSGYSFQVLAVSNRSGLSTAIPNAKINNSEPQFDFKFHSDRLEKLEFEKKQRSNSGLFRVVLTKKSWLSMRKHRYQYLK